MESCDLRKLHKAILVIASEIDRVCQKNNIKYTLIGGSLLGAVRHKGFIPWDDDFDVGMLRSEYERFLQVCKNDLGEQFKIQTNETDPYYVYGFTKVLLKGTYLVQYGHEKTKHEKGIYVDIFPYDYIPDTTKERKEQSRKNYLFVRMLRRKFGSEDSRNWGIREKIAFGVLDCINLFIPQRQLICLLNKNMKKYSGSCYEFVSNMSGFYGYEKETVPARFFDDILYVPFENKMFPITAEFDAFLQMYFGDYMQLPPKDKRRTHGFQTLDFGPYSNI